MKPLLCVLLLALCACGSDDLGESFSLGPAGEPDELSLGLRLVPEGVELNLDGRSSADIDRIARGSYLVNGVGQGCGCHSIGPNGYLAGGFEFNSFLGEGIEGNTTVGVRNLTPHPVNGLLLSEEEFVAAMKTGLDVADTERTGQPQRMLFMPVQNYRHMTDDDLRAVYAFLQALPAIDNEVRTNYTPGFPFRPVDPPAYSSTDPVARGHEILQRFSTGPEAEAFAAAVESSVSGLPTDEQDRIGRGSYLVNAVAACASCHSNGEVIQGTVDIDTQVYLAGGTDLAGRARLPFPVFSRNLTPHPDTGLDLTGQQFFDVIRYGADFRRPGGSLRVQPHWPSVFAMSESDVQSIYSFLQVIPPLDNAIEITEAE